MTSSFIQTVSDSRKWQELLTTHDKVVVDFWAPWCGPCRTLAPVFEQVAQDPDCAPVTFCKINIDDCPDIAGQYQVLSIPTMIFLHNGREKDRKIGGIDGRSLKNWILSTR